MADTIFKKKPGRPKGTKVASPLDKIVGTEPEVEEVEELAPEAPSQPKSSNKTKRPWQPARRTEVDGVDKSIHVRWVHFENYERRLADGWVVAKRNDTRFRKVKAERSLHDGMQLDNCFIRGNELVLMYVPVELRKEMQAYYDRITDEQTAKRTNEALADRAVGKYMYSKGNKETTSLEDVGE